MNDTQQFYDGFADDYAFIFVDWQASVKRQSQILNQFLHSLGIESDARVRDVTCGIGTQAIALALAGYQVDAVDLSPKSVDQAQVNAEHFGISDKMSFGVADLLAPVSNPTKYNLVMAMDNPIAHFHTDEALRTAFSTMKNHSFDGGVLMTSLRDYDTIVNERPRQSHIQVTEHEGIRRVMFQVWDWNADATSYQSEMFVLTQDGDTWQTSSHKTSFRAWRQAEVTQRLDELGLHDIQWHDPENSGFYQLIVTARR